MDGGSAQAIVQEDIKLQVKKHGLHKRHVRLVQTSKERTEAEGPDPGSTASDGPRTLVTCGAPNACRKGGVMQGSMQAFSQADMHETPAFCQQEQGLLHYFWAYLFASHYLRYPPALTQAGRNWLTANMIKMRPLADLTLALSACHCHANTRSTASLDDSTWRYYYDRGLRGLRYYLQSFENTESLQAVRVALQLLACNMQLLTLDQLTGSETRSIHLIGRSELINTISSFAFSAHVEALGASDQDGLDFILQVSAPSSTASIL